MEPNGGIFRELLDILPDSLFKVLWKTNFAADRRSLVRLMPFTLGPISSRYLAALINATFICWILSPNVRNKTVFLLRHPRFTSLNADHVESRYRVQTISISMNDVRGNQRISQSRPGCFTIAAGYDAPARQ